MTAPRTLRITVVNGDLTFERDALLLGHYHATRLTGTEKVMDRLIGGAMWQSLAMGVYPVAIGSHQIFINTHPNVERGTFLPRPRAVVIAGLGEEGKLRAADLVQSVRQAVIAWAQRLAEEGRRIPRTFELTSTLLGSGGAGVSPGEAARLIAEGVYRANVRIADEDDTGGRRRTPRVRHLRFIELYLDRATDAWRSLRLQSEARPGRYVVDKAVEEGTGALERPADLGYRGAEFDFISVAATTDRESVPAISYTLDTRRARSEVRAQRTQSLLIKELVASASIDPINDEQIGRTLFGLLIPIELEAYLAGSGEMQIELDPQTAAIPWELLDTNGAAAKAAGVDDELPWALRVNLLRKLRIAQFRELVTDAGPDASALVIGAPDTPPAFPRLPGAHAEAAAVRSRLVGRGGLDESAVMALVSPDADDPGPSARDVVNALFDRPWRLVHIAGHGAPGESGKAGGVVLSNGTFLGAAEIGNMRTVPELVFINCCHLGAADAGQLLNTLDRAAFASGVAGELIAIGVRCVIAAGWAVDDEGARVFADAFYSSLVGGHRFITAVGAARLAAYRYAPAQNTWAAYQCYGDPDWVFRQLAPDPNRDSVRVSEDFSGVASAAALKLALQRLIVEIRFQGADPAAKLDGVRSLATHFGKRWGMQGDVAELFGEAFAEAGDVENGLQWYETALAAADGRASFKSAEQLGALRSQCGWALVDEAARNGGETRARARVLRAAISRADVLMEDAVILLATLADVSPTVQRLNLMGSAYKYRALVSMAAGRGVRVRRDLALMAASYDDALRLAVKGGNDAGPSSAANALLADVALNAGRVPRRKLDAKMVAVIEAWLKKTEPTFVSVIGGIQLDQYRALAERQLAVSLPALGAAYADARSQVKSVRLWRPVYDAACLVLPNYAARTAGKERAAAAALLTQLRGYVHPP